MKRHEQAVIAWALKHEPLFAAASQGGKLVIAAEFVIRHVKTYGTDFMTPETTGLGVTNAFLRAAQRMHSSL